MVTQGDKDWWLAFANRAYGPPLYSLSEVWVADRIDAIFVVQYLGDSPMVFLAQDMSVRVEPKRETKDDVYVLMRWSNLSFESFDGGESMEQNNAEPTTGAAIAHGAVGNYVEFVEELVGQNYVRTWERGMQIALNYVKAFERRRMKIRRKG